MQFKIYELDLYDLCNLRGEREKVKENVDGGSLKRGDVEILWSERKDLITVRGKDIKT